MVVPSKAEDGKYLQLPALKEMLCWKHHWSLVPFTKVINLFRAVHFLGFHCYDLSTLSRRIAPRLMIEKCLLVINKFCYCFLYVFTKENTRSNGYTQTSAHRSLCPEASAGLRPGEVEASTQRLRPSEMEASVQTSAQCNKGERARLTPILSCEATKGPSVWC